MGILLFIFGMSVYESGWWNTVNDVNSMLDECRWYQLLGIVLFILFMGSLLFVSPILTRYMENTVTIFSDKCVHVRRYLRKEIIVTYEELATIIKRRKIRIKNGRYVIPCKGRNVSISMIGGAISKRIVSFVGNQMWI